MPLQTVESNRLYRQIAEQLRSLIAAGEFAPASRLPAERDLARQLGVSRPSVREALIALEVEGWVEVRTGSGIYVRQPLPRGAAAGHDSAEWGPLELMRARELVEGEVAALAARHAKRAQVAAMAGALARMQEQADAGIVPREGDEAFHAAVAGACGNEVLRDTVMGYWQARSGPLFERLGDYFENPASWSAALVEHAQVLEAIRGRDPQAAREAMHLHLQRACKRYGASWRRANASHTPPAPLQLRRRA
ncbi:FadR/GntR family transcriptional regulator [Ramlibacter tataouinensis]|uniref:Transcriptional regulator, GntR family-like protein n=1 Tax=Ramlibacter tataouinensis (strain ATCC BAA-407 / DSM 14655 / LMG 21543 / TTB310) TaxID=365046 RepID=F5XYZ9_RAMTT|nr:FadR/GntR family transcriptional regulator [Ramlibacter tataouinensis]AEG91987.1 transcriptional regulator, GntR family-like protein [Ramlibacter tataouinensis TTB310]